MGRGREGAPRGGRDGGPMRTVFGDERYARHEQYPSEPSHLYGPPVVEGQPFDGYEDRYGEEQYYNRGVRGRGGMMDRGRGNVRGRGRGRGGPPKRANW
eukprot:CFRG6337T1